MVWVRVAFGGSWVFLCGLCVDVVFVEKVFVVAGLSVVVVELVVPP